MKIAHTVRTIAQRLKTVKRGTWIALHAVLIAGFFIGRFTAGIDRVSARTFLAYLPPKAESLYSTQLIGASHERAYLEHWSMLGMERRVVLWTPLSDLPPDIAQQLREGKYPWEGR